ncbi:MAG: hypothetical protein EAX86_10535 [Candidatus Heimdallarchaeota archaeon]|nr:hypothetical protein [Candidatus Heimdallarchaeota archaeon]
MKKQKIKLKIFILLISLLIIQGFSINSVAAATYSEILSPVDEWMWYTDHTPFGKVAWYSIDDLYMKAWPYLWFFDGWAKAVWDTWYGGTDPEYADYFTPIKSLSEAELRITYTIKGIYKDSGPDRFYFYYALYWVNFYRNDLLSYFYYRCTSKGSALLS